VLTALAPGASGRMQFVMERRFAGNAELLPEPRSPRVERRAEAGYVCAAVKFTGWPLDHEVVREEKALRAALLADELSPQPGSALARYNEPSVPPPLRRNEVLIRLNNFEWP